MINTDYSVIYDVYSYKKIEKKKHMVEPVSKMQK